MSKKDVIYIDIEDDITAIIDKVKVSKAEIVALVPPKRSTVLQSAVNMKLLKRIADKDSKKIVLISSESSLMPLAGGVGLFMADSLQSRPKIPEVEKADVDDSVIEDDELIDDDAAEAVSGAVGAAAVSASKKTTDGPRKSKKARSEKLEALKGTSKIPDFSKFRLHMILGGLGIILLIVLWFVGFRVMPKANIVVQAQTARVPVDTELVVATDVETNIDNAILKAEQETLTKAITEEFDATGEKDIGDKAEGTMTVQNCYSSTSLTVPAGTTFNDPSTGNKFTSNSDVTVPGGVFVGTCTTPGEETVEVTAVNSGDDKNLSPRSYTVSGYSGKVTGYGDQMSGGTTKIVKVVSQSDIKAATKKIQERNNDVEKQELAEQFGDDGFAITESFVATASDISSSPAANSEASKATLTAKFTYTMIGVDKEQLNQFLEAKEKDSLGETDQSILETGIDQVVVSIINQVSPTNITIGIKTNGFAGPKIDTEALKQEIANKRYSEAIAIIEQKDGVSSTKIDLSPFWVSHIPGNLSKINIELEVSDHNLQ